MKTTKKKAKIVAHDHGGLMMAATQLHPEVLARQAVLADSETSIGAATSLEDFSARLEALESMTDIFDEKGSASGALPFDDQENAPGTFAGNDSPASVEVAEQEEIGGEVFIGGIDDETVDFSGSFEDDQVAFEDVPDHLSIAGLQDDDAADAFDPAEIAFEEVGDLPDFGDTDSTLAGAETGQALFEDDFPADFTDEFQRETSSEDNQGFGEIPELETLDEDEARANAEISERIIEFHEVRDIPDEIQEDFPDFEEGPGEFAEEQPDPDEIQGEVFTADDAWANPETETDDAPGDWDMAGIDDEDASGNHDMPADIDAASDEFPGGNWEDVADGGSTPDDSDSADDAWQDGDDDWLANSFPETFGEGDRDRVESLAAEEFIPEVDNEQIDAILGEIEAGESEGDRIDWDAGSFEESRGKAVDSDGHDIHGYDLSDDNDDQGVAMTDVDDHDLAGIVTDEKTEGDSVVRTFEDEDQADPGFADLSEDLDDEIDEAPAAKPARKQAKAGKNKPASGKPAASGNAGSRRMKMAFLAVSVAVGALVSGAGYVMVKPYFGSAPQPAPAITQEVGNPAPAPVNVDVTIGNQGTDTRQVPTVSEPLGEDPSFIGPETSLGDDLFGENADVGDISDLSMPADDETGPAEDGAQVEFPGEEDRLSRIAAGLETAGTDNLDDLFLNDDAGIEVEEPAADLDAALADFVKISDFELVNGQLEEFRVFLDEFRGEMDNRESEIAQLQADLAESQAQAARAEQLALAQNEVLVKVVRVQDKVDMAESLIVDLSRRIAAIETTDPADRVAVERSLEQLDSQVKGLTRDIGLIARVAINGSPVSVGSDNGASVRSSAGGDAVFAEGGTTKRPATSGANVPADAKKGDFVEGFGYVLDVIPTSDGSNLIVMENGSALK